MLRTDLVNKLEICKAALSDNALVPIMTHFWFRGDSVMAYNDKIAISIPLETDFITAVPGLELLALLKASKAKDVELEHKDRDLTIHAGNTKAHIETMDKSNFVFDMPAPGKPTLDKLDGKAVTAALQTCLLSISYDNSTPDQTGVTVMIDRGELLFFGTNYQTLSHVWMKYAGSAKLDRAILNGEFAAQLAQMAGKGDMALEIGKDKNGQGYAIYEAPGDVLLFGKLVESKHPLRWFDILKEHYPDDGDKHQVAIPTKMELILDRAAIAAASSDKPAFMEINVKGGHAKFRTSAHRMEVNDTVELDKGQPDCSLRVNPKLVKAGYQGLTKMLLTERAFVLAGKNVLYMVAHSSEG